MTTPSVNIDVLESLVRNYKYYYPGQPPFSEGIQTFQNIRMGHRSRPQSVNNPLRADFTRRPSAFQQMFFEARAVVGKEVRWNFNRTFLHEESGDGVFRPPTMAQILPWMGGSGSFPPTVSNIAKTRMLLNASNTKIQLGVTLAEYRKTVTMCSGLARRASIAVDRFQKRYFNMTGRKGRKAFSEFMGNTIYPGTFRLRDGVVVMDRAAARKTRNGFRRPSGLGRSFNGDDAVNDWLLVNYGLTPTYYEVVGAAQALSDTVDKWNHVPTILVRGQHVREDESTLTWFSGQSEIGNWEIPITRSWKSNYSCLYRVDGFALRDMSSWGLTNLASTLWELIPYSFVVDQAIQIGDWLEACYATAGLTFIEGSESRTCAVTTNGPGRLIEGVPHSQFVSSSSRGGNVLARCFRREPISSAIGPGIPFLPGMRNRLGLRNLANDLSLLVNAMR